MTPTELKKYCEGCFYLTYGDLYEKKSAVFTKSFRQHEEFWKYVIVPCTNRVDISILKKDEKKLQFRKDCIPRLQRIAQTHYSIYMHFRYVLQKKSALLDKLQEKEIYLVEDLFSHLRSVFDLTDNLFFHLALFFYGNEGLLREKDLDFCKDILPFSEKELDHTYEIEKTQYRKDFSEKYLENGIPLLIYFNKIRPLGEKFLKSIGISKTTTSSYKKLRQRTADYRDYFQHNQLLGQCIDQNNKIWIPRSSVLGKYTLWNARVEF